MLLWDGGRALGQTLLLSGPPQNWEVGDRGRLAFLRRWGIHGRGNLAFLLRGNRLYREFEGAVSPAPTIDWQWPTGSTQRDSRAFWALPEKRRKSRSQGALGRGQQGALLAPLDRASGGAAVLDKALE